MSHAQPTAAASSHNFQLIFNNALKAYERRTNNDLLAHPLRVAAQLQACNSPSAVLIMLRQRAQELNRSRTSDERLTKWLDPTVNVLYAFSGALGEGVGLVGFMTCDRVRFTRSFYSQAFSPAKVIFAGVGVLLLVCITTYVSPLTLHGNSEIESSGG